MSQQPSLSSLAQNGEAGVNSSSISKAAVLPLLADATASSVTLADGTLPGSVALPQMQSKEGRSRPRQPDSSSQWAKEVIEVISARATRNTCAKHLGRLHVRNVHLLGIVPVVAYI